MRKALLIALLLIPVTSFANETYNCDYFVRHKHIPNYEGEYGYLSVDRHSISENSGRPNSEHINLPLSQNDWFVPHYKQVGPTTWGESGKALPHKAYVKVIRQHLGYHFHVKGLLEVNVVSKDGRATHEVINYRNFTPVKYWKCPIDKAVRFSPVLANLKEVIRPLNKDGLWMENVNIDETLLCTSSYRDHRVPKVNNSMTSPIKCWIYSQKKLGYFEAKNLKISY